MLADLCGPGDTDAGRIGDTVGIAPLGADKEAGSPALATPSGKVQPEEGARFKYGSYADAKPPSESGTVIGRNGSRGGGESSRGGATVGQPTAG